MSIERHHPLIVVSSYTQFDNLAHGPRGSEAKMAMWTFRLNPSTGRLLLVSVDTEPVCNPAFTRVHPFLDKVYACTESVTENGEIVSYDVNSQTGNLTIASTVDARGTSTCYITLDKEARNMLVVNYWDATIHVFGTIVPPAPCPLGPTAPQKNKTETSVAEQSGVSRRTGVQRRGSAPGASCVPNTCMTGALKAR